MNSQMSGNKHKAFNNSPYPAAFYCIVTNGHTAAIADITGFHAEIVSELPASGQSNILYLVAKSTAASGDGYDEYLYINGAWERVGSTDIDLSGYVQAADMHAITNTEISDIINQVWS